MKAVVFCCVSLFAIYNSDLSKHAASKEGLDYVARRARPKVP